MIVCLLNNESRLSVSVKRGPGLVEIMSGGALTLGNTVD